MNASKLFLLFIGRPQVGKTTCSKLCSKLTGLRQGSTSEYVYQKLAEKLGVTVAELYRMPKEQIRPQMVVVGDEICAKSPTGLVDGLVEQDIRLIDGVRRKGELRSVLNKLRAQGHSAYAVWVNKPDAPIIKDNTEVTTEDADFIIENDGDFAQLEERLKTFLATLK